MSLGQRSGRGAAGSREQTASSAGHGPWADGPRVRAGACQIPAAAAAPNAPGASSAAAGEVPAAVRSVSGGAGTGAIPDAAAGTGPAAGYSPEGACRPRPGGPGDAGGVPGPRVAARSLAGTEFESRYQRLVAEVAYLYEAGLMTPIEAARCRHQARALYEAALADLAAWQAAAGC
jgi:hypothetical protein